MICPFRPRTECSKQECEVWVPRGKWGRCSFRVLAENAQDLHDRRSQEMAERQMRGGGLL